MDWDYELVDLLFIAGQVTAGVCMAYGAYLVWEHQRGTNGHIRSSNVTELNRVKTETEAQPSSSFLA
jgi:hypothetical protein